MQTTSISSTTLQFLKDLAANNNREWFTEHKARYVKANNNVKAFADTLNEYMGQHDNIERYRTYRIYRDVRFSKDKTPYKNSMSGNLVRATHWLRGGYYFHIEPGASFVGGGFWNPNSKDLRRIRQEIAADPDELRKIVDDKKFKEVFGELAGDKVKTAPRGYAKDHPAIDLLRHKQFLVMHSFTDKEVQTEGFVKKVDGVFQAMRPFFNYMSEVLTTDENGVPLEYFD